MFNPSRDQARQFFFEVWRKYRAAEPLSAMEGGALDVVLRHPEYHPVLDDPERYLDRDYLPEFGETNPFLHLALHLAIEEQLSIDQPPGIRAEFEKLLAKTGDAHEAAHQVMECLVEMIWQSQRNGTQFDAALYLDCLGRR